MKTLVTGASGFIGTNLVRALVARGQTVRILRRPSSNLMGLVGLPIEDVVGDLLDADSVRKAVRGCQYVFHAAAEVQLAPLNRERLRQTNLVGTENIARACLEERVERLVYTSSTVTIGYGTAEHPATEESQNNLTGWKLPYIDTKCAAEAKVVEYVSQGLPAVIVNPSFVFGPWDQHPKTTMILVLAGQGQLKVYTDGGLSVVDVDDVVQGHLLAMEKGRIRERYILSNENLTWKAFMTLANEYAGKGPPRFRIPWRVALAAGYVGDMVGRIFRVTPSLSSGMARFYSVDFYVSAEKAKRELGYRPTPLAESLEKTFEWLETHRYIPPRQLRPNVAHDVSAPRSCRICTYQTTVLRSEDLGTVRGNTERFKHQWFHLWRCPQCGSIQNIDPVDYRDIYVNYPLNKRRLDVFARGTMANLLGRLKRAGMKRSDAILDYGCGNGLFIRFLEEKGYVNVTGYDPHVPTFSRLPDARTSFDCVVLNDTIEHCDDFRALISECVKYVRPGGLFYIGTPDTTGVEMNNLDAQIMKLHQPFHRVIVTVDTLNRLCTTAGLELISTYRRSYLDTRRPFANYRFLDEFSRALGHDLDLTLDPKAGLVVLRKPWLLFYAFFGYWFPSAYEPALILRKPLTDENTNQRFREVTRDTPIHQRHRESGRGTSAEMSPFR